MLRIASFVILALLFGSILGIENAVGQQSEKIADEKKERADQEGVVVSFDKEKNETTIAIPARNGKLTWMQISRTVMKYADADADSIVFPEKDESSQALDLTKFGSKLSLFAADLAMGDGVDFDVEKDPWRLKVKIQHEFVGGKLRAIKARLRSLVLGREDDWQSDYKIKFASGEPASPSGQQKENQLCLFVHGLNSSSDVMKPLANRIQKLGYRVAYFDYPNDDRITSSAKRLSSELKSIREKNPNLKVTIIAHSMGGLVSRKTVEEKTLDPHNVCNLCLVCTPSHGSRLARYAFGIDLIEHFFVKRDKNTSLSRFKSSFADGLNEAAHDLRPDSPFLQHLNSLHRNKDIQYSLFIGTDGAVPEVTDASLEAAKASIGHKMVKKILDYPKKKLNQYEEVVKGKGDGVVSVQSAMLEGVTDVEKFRVTHSSMWFHPDEPESQKLFDAIIKRLD